MKLFLPACLLLLTMKTACQFPVANGKITRFKDFHSAFVQKRNIDVWLPDGYHKQKKYPVLYMHDGQMIFDSTSNWNKKEWQVDETMSSLIREKKIQECIVVGIWNAGIDRHIEYCPQKPFETMPAAYRDSMIRYGKKVNGDLIFSGKIKSDAYLAFLVKELKPFIDKKFSTKKDRENTFIAGSSMGGLISLYAICEYPLVFGGAACLSTHWTITYTEKKNPFPAAINDYLLHQLPDPKTHRIYFDYGNKTLDTLYEPFQKMVDKIMAAKGYDSRNWTTISFPGENHSEDAWARRFHIPALFLAGNSFTK